MDKQTDVNNISACSFNFWKQSYDAQHRFWAMGKKHFTQKYINQIDNTFIDLHEKSNRLKKAYEDELVWLITFYKKSDFICACITLKEYFIKILTHHDRTLQFINDEQECILNLLNLALTIDDNDFRNNPFNKIVSKYSYFIDIITISRLYIMLCTNITRLDVVSEQSLKLSDIAFELIETEEFNQYYDEFSAMGNLERPEDYIFRNENITYKLDMDNKSIEKILKDSSELMEPIFGFKLTTLSLMSTSLISLIFEDDYELKKAITDDDFLLPVIVFDRSKCIESVNSFTSENELMKIIEAFEIKQDNSLDYEMQINKLELSCFYRDKNYVYFGLIDLVQKFEMFRKFSLSGNHMDLWVYSDCLGKALQKSQKKLSTYLCYTLADELVYYGYKMHTETFGFEGKQYVIPTVEEHSIKIGGSNVTDKYGDYDLIFLDDYKDQIICVEFKYFKPSMTYRQLIRSDKNKLKKQILGDGNDAKKITAREIIVKDNISYFIEYLQGNPQKNYSVKTIVVTARPNLYAFSKEIKDNNLKLNFYSINSFKEAVEKHDI